MKPKSTRRATFSRIVTTMLVASALSAASATAATFQFRQPALGLVSSPTVQSQQAATAILVALTGGPALPAGEVNSPYSYDLNQLLSVTGDSAYSASGVAWSLPSGALPAGLSLGSNGVISGVPTTKNLIGDSFLVSATYKTKTVQQAYAIIVTRPPVGIVLQAAGYRTWADGTYATSCNGYRNPSAPNAYTGSTGDGVYRIQPSGQVAADVKCDMTNDGGGWTLVAGISAANRNHVTAGVSTWSALTLAAPKGKHADAFINAVNAATEGSIGYRLTSGTMTSYFPATCAFAATAVATGACGTYTQTYSVSPTWVTGATTSDGCSTPTYYTGLSSIKHAACNGASVPADNGGLVYARVGNTGTNGMVTDKNGNYVQSADGELWVR